MLQAGFNIRSFDADWANFEWDQDDHMEELWEKGEAGVDFDSSLIESNKLRSSTGLAANWLSPLGPMSFVFSTNLAKDSTDETESFNFNLGTTF